MFFVLEKGIIKYIDIPNSHSTHTHTHTHTQKSFTSIRPKMESALS